MSQAAAAPAQCWSPFSGGLDVLRATDQLAASGCEHSPINSIPSEVTNESSDKQPSAEGGSPPSKAEEERTSLPSGGVVSQTPPPSPPESNALKDAAPGLTGVRAVVGSGSRVDQLRALEADTWNSWARPGSPLTKQVELASAANTRSADFLASSIPSNQAHAVGLTASFASSPSFGPSTAALTSNAALLGGTPAATVSWPPHRQDHPLAATRPRSGSVDSSFLGRYPPYHMNQLQPSRGFASEISSAALLRNNSIIGNGSVNFNGSVAPIGTTFNGISAGCSCNCGRGASAALSTAQQTAELLVTPPSSPFSYFSSKAVFGDNDHRLASGMVTPPTPKRRLSAPCVFTAGGVAPRPELVRHRLQQSTLFGLDETSVASDMGFGATASSYPGQSLSTVHYSSGDAGSRQLLQFPEAYRSGLPQIPQAGEETEDGLTEADRQLLVRDMFESYFSDRRIWGLIQNLSSRAISHSGWCSIAPVTMFSKITRITTSMDTIINALRRSSILQLSQDRTRVRRLDRPNLLSSIAAAKSWRNTVYMLGFPPAVRKAELFEYFSAFGRVSSITLCPSLTGAPTTVLAEFVTADMAARCILHGSHVFQGCQIEIVSRRTTKRHSGAGSALSGGATSSGTSPGNAPSGLSVTIPSTASSAFPPLGTPQASPATAPAAAMFHPGMQLTGFYQQH